LLTVSQSRRAWSSVAGGRFIPSVNSIAYTSVPRDTGGRLTSKSASI
jgi:hypothetical protein